MEEEDNINIPIRSKTQNSSNIPIRKSKVVTQKTALQKTFNNTGGIARGFNTGYGQSDYDKNLNWDAEIGDNIQQDINEHRAQNQSWGAKASAGIARAGTKAVIEIAKLAPTVAGVLSAPFAEDGDGWETAFNNTGHQALNAINEDINNKLLPVYVKKAVSEGSLWDNLSSIDFYATEGADGLGFMLSMFAPGAALKALGGANKFKGLLGGFEKGRNFMSKAANLGLKADEVGITLANTFAEAAAESGSQMEAMNQAKPDIIKGYLAQIDKDRRDKKITIEEANRLSTTEALEAKFNQQKGSVGKESFWMNMGLLAVTNFANTKMLGLAGESATKKVGSQALRGADGNILKSVATRSLYDRAKDIPLKAGKMFLNEGFVEEGTQSTIENYLSGKAKEGKLTGSTFKDFNLKEFGEEYVDMVTTTEGQKAIALGGILGYGSTAVRSAKQLTVGREITDPETGLPTKVRQTDDDLEISRVNRLLAKGIEAEAYFAQINPDIYKRTDEIDPETGENKFEIINGKKVIDEVKRDKLLLNTKITEDDSKLWDKAIAENDIDTLEYLQNMAEARLINSFIADSQDGLSILSEYLKNSNLPEDRKKSIMEKATITQKSHEQFISYAQPVLNLKNKDASKEDLQEFYNTLVNTNKWATMQKVSASQVLDNHNKKIDDLLSQHSLDRSSLENEKLRSQLAQKDIRFQHEQQLETYYNSQLEDIKKTNLDLWNPKKQQEAFDKLVADNKTKRENNSAENVANANAIMEAIQAAKTVNDVDNADTDFTVDENGNTVSTKKPVDPLTSEVIETLKDDKKAEIVTEDKNTVAKNNESVKDEIEKSLDFSGDLEYREEFQMYQHTVTGEFYDSIEEYNEEVRQKNGIEIKEELPVDINESQQPDLTDLVNENAVEDEKVEDPVELQNIEKGDKPQFPGITAMGMNTNYKDKEGNILYTWSTYVSDTFKTFINNFKSVVNTPVTFKIPEYLSSENKDALSLLNSGRQDFNTVELNKLHQYLPLQVNIDTNIYTFIAPAVNNGKEKLTDEEFRNTPAYQARKLIVDAIIKHGYENVTSKIQYQKGGILKYLPAGQDTNILSLKEFDNKPENVKLFWVQDVDGNVINESGAQADRKSEFPFTFKNAHQQKGYVYTIIHSPGGKSVRLKLNVRKITSEQAEMIYRVYETLYNYNQNPEGGIRLGQNNAKLTDLYKVDPTLKTLIEQDFETEFKLFKNGDQTTIGNFMTLFIHDNVTYEGETKPYTTKYQGGEVITGQEGVLSFEGGKMSKEDFLKFLTTKKRQNTKIEYLTSNFINGEAYKKYLLKQVTSVNIDTQKPFDGDINVYIDSNVTVIEKPKVQSDIEVKKADIEKISNEDINNKLESLKEDLIGIIEKPTGFKTIPSSILQEESAKNLNVGDRIFTQGKKGTVTNKGSEFTVRIKFDDNTELVISPSQLAVYKLKNIENLFILNQSKTVNKSEIEKKRQETEAKIKRKDLFSDGGYFANELGGSGIDSIPTNHREINGIEFVEFSNPNTGIIDVVMTGTSNSDFVGYYRLYEKGKPTEKWSSKFENQSRNKENFKTMISGVQKMLPQGHEYTEKTSISTDGLRVWNQQLSRGYELQYDNKGNLITNTVAINGDAIVNELEIDVNQGNFDNISVTNKKQFQLVKKALLPYLQKFGLDENNIYWTNGTIEIDLPVLKKKETKTNVDTKVLEEQPIFNIETKKADIERRREKELSNIPQELSKEETLNKAKLLVAKSKGDKIANRFNYDNVSYIEDLIYHPEGWLNENDIDFFDKNIKNNLGLALKGFDLSNTNKIRIDKINAKYDAELKALESNQNILENNTQNTLISNNVNISLDESYKTEAITEQGISQIKSLKKKKGLDNKPPTNCK